MTHHTEVAHNETHSSDALFTISGTSVASGIIFLTLITNTLLLLILSRAKSTRKIRNDCYGYYLINLCVTNIVAALVCIVTSVLYSSLTCEHFSQFLQIFCALHVLSSSICVETIALMTLERHLIVQNPLHRYKFSRKKLGGHDFLKIVHTPLLS